MARVSRHEPSVSSDLSTPQNGSGPLHFLQKGKNPGHHVLLHCLPNQLAELPPGHAADIHRFYACIGISPHDGLHRYGDGAWRGTRRGQSRGGNHLVLDKDSVVSKLGLFSQTKTDWTHWVHKALDVCPIGRLLVGLDLKTLGTRAQIPTGYMVKTLRSQSTFDSNMPSDQMLSTF